MKQSDYLTTAIEAAKLGGSILIDRMKSKARQMVDRKQRFDFVTEVDHESEKAIIDFILKRHPDHQILAEESGGIRETTTYLW
ncbi:MAG: inositol monophosphatase, partial [Calditrichaeota bacterium]